MSVSEVHQLHGVLIDVATLDDTQIGGIVRQTVNTGTQIIKESSAGSIFPEVSYVNAARPGASFDTVDIEDALVALGLRGLCIATDTGDPGVSLYGRIQLCNGPGAEASTIHQQYLFSKGVLVPQTLTIDHQANAVMSCVIAASYDGTNLPLIVNSGVAVPVFTPDTARWTMERMTILGVTISQKQNITFDFGNRINVEDADGDLYPTWVSIAETEPRLTIRGTDVKNWFPSLTGSKPVHATSSLYLLKRGVATGSAGHIRIQLSGLAYTETVFDAQGNDTGQTDLIIECAQEGANDPVLFTTNTTIT